jgi:hypothetical protein
MKIKNLVKVNPKEFDISVQKIKNESYILKL